MNQESREFLLIILPVIGTFFGTALGFAGSIILTRLNQKGEERKQIRSLTFNAGVENWKGGLDFALKLGRKAEIPPIEFFILNMMFLSRLLEKKDIDKEQLKEFLTQKNRTMNELITVMKELESEDEK